MPEQPAQEIAGQVIAFGPFRLRSAQRLLLEGDTPVRLGSRACEVLLALVEKPGQVVGKRELLARVWPDTFVEEASLRVHIAALRRALGDGNAGRRYITNVPGRGYSFVAPISVNEEQTGPSAAPPSPSSNVPPPNMPLALARMVGRSDVISALAEQLSRSRFVTVVGPGGIGKTTVALAVANRVLPDFADGVHFIDLAPLNDPLLVPSTVAARLGVGVHSENPLPALIAFLKEKNALIVLDSCEHVIEAAATFAEEIFGGTERPCILATSREALRAEGEHVHRLPPLAFPSESESLGREDALGFPAIQLFVGRAAASLGSFELASGEVPVVAEICRRLDGIPLAIEIAASRVDTFGVAGLAAGLNDRFRLLMQGRRTALPRHRTLSATLDWSYSHLSEPEQLVLRRLATFVGAFTMEAASAVLAQDMSDAAIFDAIANLVAKSLVWADVGGATAFYRLFDVTRAYAYGKLEESGEGHRFARAHAQYYRSALDDAQREWETRPAPEWLQSHRHVVDNVRAALDWAFTPGGDPATGVAITIGAVPLWFELSMTSECAERVDRALGVPSVSGDTQSEMRLYAARAWSLMQTQGALPATQDAWTRVLVLAEKQGDVDYQLRALWGLWSGLLNRSEFRSALQLAERFSALATTHSSGADVLIGERMVGYIVHLMGDQSRARRHIERMLGEYVAPVTGAQIIRFVFDQRGIAQCFLARILWLQGAGDQAVNLTKEIVGQAVAQDDGLSLCQALVQGACPVALFVGDLEALERHVSMLLDYSERHALEFWQAFGRCFQGVLYVRRGDLAEGLAKLAEALDGLRGIQFGVYYGVFLCEFADALARVGRTAEASRVIDEALTRAERNEEFWYQSELLRVKGEIVLRQALPNASQEAERYFLESLDWSKRQETIAWRLRTATSLARLYQKEARVSEARDVLAPVYGSFGQGLETADAKEARELLKLLAAGKRGRNKTGGRHVTGRD